MNKQSLENSTKAHKPQWWQLYLMLPLLAGLYLPEMRLQLSGAADILAQLAILGLIFAFLHCGCGPTVRESWVWTSNPWRAGEGSARV
jgi:hypothetical protein